MLNKAIIVFAVYTALNIGLSSADECVACDSTKEANCAQNPEKLPLVKCPTLASNETPKCYIRIVERNTYRGCYGELDQGVRDGCLNNTKDSNCAVCENLGGAKGCNNFIFPGDRLRCHTCSENNLIGNCFKANDGNAPACKLYSPEDRCYIRKTAKSIERGCLTDTVKCANATQCLICDGNSCNNQEGNSTEIPTAPSSAVAWTPTMFIVLVATLVCSKFTA